MARKAAISVPFSRFRLAILGVLVREGYLLGVRTDPPASPRDPQFNSLQVFLKYDAAGIPAIKTIKRASTPSKPYFSSIGRLPPANGGLGTWILTTPKGVLTCAEARAHNVGGEVIGVVGA